MSVYDQSEISFSIPQGTLPSQLISVGFIHRTEFGDIRSMQYRAEKSVSDSLDTGG